MNKNKVVLLSILLNGLISNVNSQYSPEDTITKKEFKNSIGVFYNLLSDNFNTGVVYRKSLPKTVLKLGLHSDVSSDIIYSSNNQKDITMLTTPDSNNVFLGVQKSSDLRALKINAGIEKFFNQKELESFFYGGDVILGFINYKFHEWHNEYKIEEDTNNFDQIIYTNQYDPNSKTIENIRKGYTLGVSGNFGWRGKLSDQFSVITRLEIGSNINVFYKNTERVKINFNSTTSDFQKTTVINFNTNIWLCLNYSF